jgi:hypothetical protein
MSEQEADFQEQFIRDTGVVKPIDNRTNPNGHLIELGVWYLRYSEWLEDRLKYYEEENDPDSITAITMSYCSQAIWMK